MAHVYHLSRGGLTPRVNLELLDGDRVALTFAALPDTGASHTLIACDLVANTGLTPEEEPGLPTLFSWCVLSMDQLTWQRCWSLQT